MRVQLVGVVIGAGAARIEVDAGGLDVGEGGAVQVESAIGGAQRARIG